MSSKWRFLVRLFIALGVGVGFYFIFNYYTVEIQRLDDIYDSSFDPSILVEMNILRSISWLFYAMYFEIILILFGLVDILTNKFKLTNKKTIYLFVVSVVLTIVFTYISFFLSRNVKISWLIYPLSILCTSALAYTTYKYNAMSKYTHEKQCNTNLYIKS